VNLNAYVRAMTERQLQTQVIDMARFHGFERIYHTHDSRRSEAGFPDLVMVSTRQARVLYRELKRHGGRVSPEQKQWIDALRAAGADACVWTPTHLYSGEIEASLRPERKAA
jgi:ABC-type taurine transport system ATPase subunit